MRKPVPASTSIYHQYLKLSSSFFNNSSILTRTHTLGTRISVYQRAHVHLHTFIDSRSGLFAAGGRGMASEISESRGGRVVGEVEVSGGRGGRGGRGRGGGQGGGGGGSGGGGQGDNRDYVVSKALSWMLRHGAEKEGLVLDGEGFARCDELLKWQKLKSLQVKFPEIQSTVSTNAKQRFSLKPNPDHPTPSSTDPSHWLIRANQGHSIAISSAALLTPITLAANNIPETVVHGTYYGSWTQILESGGLSKMRRNHIHFSTGLPESGEGVISGMRADAEVLIYVDVKACLEAGERGESGGILWWRSENGVVLSEGDEMGVVGTRWWTKVVARRGDVGVLWEGGKVFKELPEDLKARKVPGGKAGGRGGGGGGKGGGRGSGRGKAERDGVVNGAQGCQSDSAVL